MACQVYRKNASLFVLSQDGRDNVFNQSQARLFISPDKIFYLSHSNLPESLMLGRYSDMTDFNNDGFTSHEDCLNYLTKHVFLSESDVFVQDQTSNIIDYFIPIPKEILTLASVPIIGSYEISLVDASNVILGDYIVIKEGKRAYQAEVLEITGNIVSMDTPIDYDFSLSAITESRSINLNVNGSITPVLADFKPPEGAIIDINVISLCITDETPMDDGKFGGITALTRGIVLRKAQNGNGFVSIFNVKTNGQMSHRMELEYSDKAPSGVYGLRAAKTTNGQSGNGVCIRLDGNKGESLQVVIQDDLTGLLTFTMTARGHIVEF